MELANKRVLLIISGGIAAYKSLDLIRRLRERGATVRAIMTAGAQEFITPLAVGALTADKVFTDLFSREDEHDVGHIRLARECDIICVAPATADLMAKMTTGQANDLATAVLLATDKPVLLAPAMNPAMWNHKELMASALSARKWAKWQKKARRDVVGCPNRWRSWPHSEISSHRALSL